MKEKAKKPRKWGRILSAIVFYFAVLVLISRVQGGMPLGVVPVIVLGAGVLVLLSLFAVKQHKRSGTEVAGDGDSSYAREKPIEEEGKQNDREKLFEALGRFAICAYAAFLFCRAFVGPMWYAEIDSNALPVIALQYHGSYVVNESDLQQAQIDFPQLYTGINSYDDLRSSKLVITKDGQWMPFYGPIYPLLCIPVKLLLTLFRVDQQRCFFLTNAILVLSALCFLQRKLKVSSAQRLLALLLLMFSPIIFYVNYINYEACIFSLLTISLTLYYNGSRKLSAFVLSLAGIANSTVMAVGIVMIGEYLIHVILAIKNEPDKRHTLKRYTVETFKYGCCFLPCLIPFAAQRILLDRSLFSPGESNMPWPRFFSYLFDPSLGFSSFAPLSVLAFFILGIVSLFKKRGAKRWRVLPWLLFLTGTVLAYSLMPHINCGMIYCARYIVWTYPILAIFLATVGYEKICSVPLKRIICVALVASPAFLLAVNLNTALDCFSFNPVTKWILDNVPQIYNPLSSTFYCRTLHEDGAYGHTEPVYYTDPRTDEVRKLIYKAYPGVEDEILRDLTGDEVSVQFLRSRLDEVGDDNEFHYLNFPKNGDHQFRIKTPEDKGEYVPGEILIDEHDVLLVPNSRLRIAELPTSISANTFYKLEIELGEEFDFDDAEGLWVDFCGEGYDFPQQEAHFLVPDRDRYELYFNSGDHSWETKNIFVRFICAASKKGQETVRIDHVTLIEAYKVPVFPPLAFQEAACFDGSDQDAHRYFPQGMSVTETDFAWTDGTEVQCCFALAEEGAEDLQLRLNLLWIYHAPQRLRVTCEDQVLYEAVVSDAKPPVDIPIPTDCVRDGNVSLTLHCPDAVSPASLGESEDGRKLAFAIKSIELVE